MTALATAYPLPWRQNDVDWRRAIGSQLIALAIVVIAGVVIPLIDLPQRIRDVRDAVQLTRITLAAPVPKVIPPPEVVPPKRELIEMPSDVALPRTPSRVLPTPVPAPPNDAVADASVAALDDAFADLRAPDARKLRAASTATAATNGPARADNALLGANQGRRAMALDASPGSVGNVALAGRSETRVNAPPAARSSRAGGGVAGIAANSRQRSLEEIHRVFDANKGSLYALYQSALIGNPGLSGKIVLELLIAADGRVERVRVVSSEIDEPSLVSQVTARVRGFRFDAKDVGATTVTYPVHFLPS